LSSLATRSTYIDIKEAAGKEVQDRYLLLGVWGVSPSFKKSPNLGGYRGLIDSISAVSLRGQLSTK
jgi:hypothetical protein